MVDGDRFEFDAALRGLSAAFLEPDIRAIAIGIWAIQNIARIVSCGHVLSGFNAPLHRPFFFESFRRQYPQTVALFHADVDDVAARFRAGRERPPPLQGLHETTSI
jgi:hypothetical protein